MQDFLRHANQLQIHISNATSEIIKSVEQLLLDSKIQQLLGARILYRLDEFHIALGKKTAQDACQWVMDDPTFRRWYSWKAAHPLVLFGDMGCGKTVTMSFIIDKIHRLNQGRIPSPLVCYHYCRDDETGQALYIYASLIQQLMREKAHVKVQFNRWCEKLQSEGYKAPAQDSALLSGFFFDSVRSLERPVFIFIDGIDECKDQSRVEVTSDLMNHSSSIAGLRVCVSSRFQEDVRTLLKGSFEMTMQLRPERDAIIVSHMANERLRFLDDKARDFVIQRLTELANGSAIWIQIAVDLLATRKIRSPAKLRAFLRDELPQSKLSDLYAGLFSQVIEDDEENAKLLADALEILAVVERPLSILELGWAVALKDTDVDATTVEDLADYVDSKRVLELVNPFIASVDFGDEKRHQVRVVHQSVRELVIQSPPSQWSSLRTSAHVSNEAAEQRRSELHGKLAQDSARYLLLDDLEDKNLFSEAQAWKQDVSSVFGGLYFSDDENHPQDSTADSTADSFFDPSDRGFGELFVYASCYWLHHLRRADHGVTLSDFITLTTAETGRFQNWWGQFLRPDCVLRSLEVAWRPEPLSIAAVYGTEALLKGILGDIDVRCDHGEKPCPNAVYAVLTQGELCRLPLLMRYNDGADINQVMQSFYRVMQAWGECNRTTPGKMTANVSKGFEQLFNHMEGSYDVIVEHEWGNGLLCMAADSGCLPFIKKLFNAAEHNQPLRRDLLRAPHRGGHLLYHQSVGEAVWNCHEDVVRFLLEQDGIEAHLKYKDAMGNTVFHKAARRDNEAIFELLISQFPDGVNQKNNSGDTPLHLVVFNGNVKPANLLLSMGRADVRCGSTEEPSDWHAPIRMAARHGNVAMCEVLVRIGGADPMSVFKTNEDGSLDFIDPFEDEKVASRVRAALFSLKMEQEGR